MDDGPNPGDLSQTGGLSKALAELVPALERHLSFAEPERARERRLWMAKLDQALPETGEGADAVLRELKETVIAHGLPMGAPGFCGWVTTMAPVVPAVSALVGSFTATQRWFVHPGNFLELLAARWLANLLGLPETYAGTFTSGGSVANLLGLGAARQHAGERLGLNPGADGVSVLPAPRVYASDQVHHVVVRALGTLGLGRRALSLVPTTLHHTIDLDALERVLDRDQRDGCTQVALVANAGNVNTGSIDPVEKMADLARARGIWLHVDGAYGGFGVLDPRVADLYGDLSKVDSLAVDPHKWLAVPVGCGAAFVRDGGLLERTFALEPAEYVPEQNPPVTDPGSCFDELGEGVPDQSLDHSAPARGLVVWAALKELGREGMRARVARHLDCARRVAERVRESEYLDLLAEPVLSICCFRYRPAEMTDEAELEAFNRELCRRVRARGRVAPSETRVKGVHAIRPCFIGPRNTVADADALVDEVLTVGRELARG